MGLDPRFQGCDECRPQAFKTWEDVRVEFYGITPGFPCKLYRCLTCRQWWLTDTRVPEPIDGREARAYLASGMRIELDPLTRSEVLAQFADSVVASHNFLARKDSEPLEVGIVQSVNGFTVYRTDVAGARAFEIEIADEGQACAVFAHKLYISLRQLRGAW